MEVKGNNYCIILAGGVGRKLWPTSRKELPKQFIDFFGTGQTLLQQTYNRFAHFIPEDNIFISTFEDYVPLVHQQLPNLPLCNILPEPVQLNTTQAAIWGTWHAVLVNPNASVVVSPADQLVQHKERFEKAILEGFDYVQQHEDFLAIGVRPSMPNTAYGYIQIGESVGVRNMYQVKSFSEKPAPDYARMFVNSGEFLWNTGIFLWNGNTMGNHLARMNNRPSMPVKVLAKQMVTIAEEIKYVRSSFTDNIPRQIDFCILEKSKNVAVMECDFGWADVGCWYELHESAYKDADGNAVSGDARVIFNGSQNCMVRLPKGMKAVIAGLDNILVAQEDNILLICPNDNPDYVQRLINESQVNL